MPHGGHIPNRQIHFKSRIAQPIQLNEFFPIQTAQTTHEPFMSARLPDLFQAEALDHPASLHLNTSPRL